jgi:hypothetical protein
MIEEHGKASNWVKRTAYASVRLAAGFFRRPDAPRIMALLLLVYFLVTRPWFMLALFLVVMLVVLIVYFSLGSDRISRLVVKWYTHLRRRDPNKAENIRRRAAFLSNNISATVDRLPQKWTRGLYLPDFEGTPELPEKMRSDPFDRLSARLKGARGAMAGRSAAPPGHSINTQVYRSNSNCSTGNNLESEDIRQGTGGKNRCPECAKLNRGIK